MIKIASHALRGHNDRKYKIAPLPGGAGGGLIKLLIQII